MSKQTTLDGFFNKSKAMNGTDQNYNKKRRSLSLVRLTTPTKTPKLNNTSNTVTKTTQEVISLCSDDESESAACTEDKSNDELTLSINSNASISSQSTITYTITPSTPQKSPQTSTKYFSPAKKRAVLKKTITRNLGREFGSSHSYSISDDNEFSKACEGMDDKSTFLLTIINNCLKNESLKKLFDEKSVDLLSSCFHIIKPGARLVCRMYWRQHGWYRREQLVNIVNDKAGDIGDAQFAEILNCLMEYGLVMKMGENTMTFDDYTKILKVDDIKQICKDLKIKMKSKEDGVQALQNFSRRESIGKFFNAPSNNNNRVIEIMKNKAGECYKISEVAASTLCKLYLLMYLGINYETIRAKNLELMLINNKIKRETYPIDKDMVVDNASIVFGSREEFEKYFKAHLIYEDYLIEKVTANKCTMVKEVYKLYQEIEKEDMSRYESLPTWLRRYTPAYIYVKMLETGIKELKKEKHRLIAIDILTMLINQKSFRQHKKGEWYAEKALVLHSLLARHDEAAAVLLEGLKSNLSEEAKAEMRPRALKIAKQQNIKLAPGLSEALCTQASSGKILEQSFPANHIHKQHMETSKNRGKKKFEVYIDDGKQFVEAEDYCIQHYTKKGDYTHGGHWEGRIATTIYFLLFWDIIYSKPDGVKGVFLSHYQHHPLDMYCGFYTNRKTAIENRLKVIEGMDTSTLVTTMKLKWDERPEGELSGISRSIGWECIGSVCRCLGSKGAAALCRRLAADYGRQAGFPDLTLWNIHTGKIKFVEVKTDTDKPSIKQLQWMQYLRDNRIEAEFCYVGVSTTRSKARAKPVVRVRSVADINGTGRA